MTREEQIKMASEIIAHGCSDELEAALIQDFPELAESEDERIRKKILDIVRAAPFDEEKDILEDWLEKQKENIGREYVFRPLAGTDIAEAAIQAIRRARDGDHLVLAFNGMYTPVSKYDSAKGLVDKYEAYLEGQERPEVDLEKEYKRFINCDSGRSMYDCARHFYELGLNARKEE